MKGFESSEVLNTVRDLNIKNNLYYKNYLKVVLLGTTEFWKKEIWDIVYWGFTARRKHFISSLDIISYIHDNSNQKIMKILGDFVATVAKMTVDTFRFTGTIIRDIFETTGLANIAIRTFFFIVANNWYRWHLIIVVNGLILHCVDPIYRPSVLIIILKKWNTGNTPVKGSLRLRKLIT